MADDLRMGLEALLRKADVEQDWGFLREGVRRSGEREVLGLDVGPSEDGAFWLQLLRSPVARQPAVLQCRVACEAEPAGASRTAGAVRGNQRA